MDEFLTLNQMHLKFMGTVTPNVHDFLNDFGSQKTLDDMFTCLWKQEGAHRVLRTALINDEKSNEVSETCRNEGNVYFGKKDFEKALEFYNTSIMNALHPPVNGPACSSFNNELYMNLAMGYANRSAVLFCLEQYQRCIKDIDRALMYGYPKNLHYKLAERKARSLLKYKKVWDAKNVLKDALTLLSETNMEEEKSNKIKESLLDVMQLCMPPKVYDLALVEPHSDDWDRDLSSLTTEQLLFAYENPAPPSLGTTHPAIPCLSNAVGISYIPAKGRHMVAQKNIYPGEVLVVEECYAHSVVPESALSKHCANCSAYCMDPLPCPLCPKVIFCGEECQLKYISGRHGRECKILPTLIGLELDRMTELAVRIILRTTFTTLKQMVPILEKEEAELPPDQRGYNEKGIYDSSDFRTVYHLVDSREEHRKFEMLRYCISSFLITQVFKESSQFFVTSGAAFTPSLDDMMLTGIMLMKHILSASANFKSLQYKKIRVDNYQQSYHRLIGEGLYPVISLANHSCDPSGILTSFGSTMILRAAQYIPKGEEITLTYYKYYIDATLKERKKYLQNFGFDCNCKACENNWPNYSNLPKFAKVKCLKCDEVLSMEADKCTGCKHDYSKNRYVRSLETGEKFDWVRFTRKFKSALNGYGEVTINDKVIPHSDVDKKILCDYVEILGRHVTAPCQPYHRAQFTFHLWCDRQGSHRYITEAESKVIDLLGLL